MNTGGCPGLLCTPPNTRVRSALSFQGGKVAFETPLSSVCSFFTSTECTGVTLVNATVRLPRAQLCNTPSIPCSALTTRPAPGLPAAKSPTPLPSPHPPPRPPAAVCVLTSPVRLASLSVVQLTCGLPRLDSRQPKAEQKPPRARASSWHRGGSGQTSCRPGRHLGAAATPGQAGLQDTHFCAWRKTPCTDGSRHGAVTLGAWTRPLGC